MTATVRKPARVILLGVFVAIFVFTTSLADVIKPVFVHAAQLTDYTLSQPQHEATRGQNYQLQQIAQEGQVIEVNAPDETGNPEFHDYLSSNFARDSVVGRGGIAPWLPGGLSDFDHHTDLYADVILATNRQSELAEETIENRQARVPTMLKAIWTKSQAISEVLDPLPAMTVTKRAHPDPVQAGMPLTYTITVTNTGSIDLHAVITDTLPSDISPSGVLTWTPTIAASGGIWTQTIVVTPNISYAGTLTNVVQVATAEGATGVYTNTVLVTAAPQGEYEWQPVGENSASGGGISNNTGTSTGPSVAVTSDGILYVAWADNSDGDDEIYVKRWENGGWAEVGAGSASGGGISNNSGASNIPTLAIAPDNTPWVAWQDDTNGVWQVYVRRWNGTVWEEVGTGSATGGGVSNTGSRSYVTYGGLAIGPDGTAYVTWDEDDDYPEIYIKQWDGSAWVEVGTGSASDPGISNTPSTYSYYPQVTVGPDNTPYVVWSDDGTGNIDFDIYVRRFVAGTWQEIGTGSASGYGISPPTDWSIYSKIAMTPDSRPYIAWLDASSGDFEVYVRHWNGTTWEEVGAGSASGGGISDNTGRAAVNWIATAPDGTPYVVWMDNSAGDDEIYGRFWTGSDWAEIGAGSATGGGISDNDGTSMQPALAIDPNGIAYLAWADDSSGNNEIYVLRWGVYFDLAVTKRATPDPVPAGNPLTYTITVTNTGNTDLQATVTDTLPVDVSPRGILTWTATLARGSVWTQTVVVTPELGYAGVLTNAVHVTTAEGASGYYAITTTVAVPIVGLSVVNDSPTVLSHPTTFTACVLSGTWQTELVDGLDSVGIGRLALDAAANPHIAYRDDTNQDLKYATYDGTNWQIQVVHSPGDTGYGPSIAVDTSGHPHVIWTDYTAHSLMYGNYDGASWNIANLSSGSWPRVGTIVLDSGDHPHVSFNADTDDTIRYHWYDGVAWHSETVDQIPSDLFAGMTLDSLDRPHIAYSAISQRDLKYAWNDGSWHTAMVYDDGQGPEAIAIDASGHPHILLQNYDSLLKHFWMEDSSWYSETVDSAVYAAVSMQFDSLDRLHVSYTGYDGPDMVVKYAYQEGGSWHIETVARGRQSWLALDAENRPHLSYYDYDRQDLRYAVRLPQTEDVVYTWDFGDGSAPVVTVGVGGAEAVVTHTYPAVGIYTAVVTASNSISQLTMTSTVTITQALLVADFTGLPLNGYAPLTTVFTDTSTGVITAWVWTFGDGEVSMVQHPTHEYTTPGTYTVTLIVAGPTGNDTETKTGYVTVNEVPDDDYYVYLPLVLRSQSPATILVEEQRVALAFRGR